MQGYELFDRVRGLRLDAPDGHAMLLLKGGKMRSRIIRHSISLRPIMTDNSVAAPVHPAISRQTIPTSIIGLHAMTRFLALDRSREKAGLQVALQPRGHDHHRHGE